jgi:hypothetical protein
MPMALYTLFTRKGAVLALPSRLLCPSKVKNETLSEILNGWRYRRIEMA